MEENSKKWPIIRLDEEFLAEGQAIDERRNQEKKNRGQDPEPPPPVELSFHCQNITVCSYLGAMNIAHAFDQVISLGTIDEFPYLFLEHPSRCRLEFDDVTGETLQKLQEGVLLPKKRFIEELFSFADKRRSVLIHCKAGVSRSPAMAILLALYWDYSLEDILAGMNTYRVYPNKLILSLGEELLNRPKGSLVGPVFERLSGRGKENPLLPVFKMGADGVYRVS